MDGLTPQAHNNRAKLDEIRSRMNRGLLSVVEAKAEAQPIIDQMNHTAERIAKEHGRKFKKFTFGYLMR